MHDSFRSDEIFRAEFYQEARLASGLSHRNIVSIIDFGEDPSFGVAVLDVSGAVEVSNSAFAHFIQRKGQEGGNAIVLDPRFVCIHPQRLKICVASIPAES